MNRIYISLDRKHSLGNDPIRNIEEGSLWKVWTNFNIDTQQWDMVLVKPE